MPRMTLAIRIALAAVLLLACCLPVRSVAAGVTAGAAFTPEQRAEVVRILRETLKQDPSILRDAIASLQADDAARQKMALRNGAAAHLNALIASDDPVGGNPRGDVTIVEFYDPRCPYCREVEPMIAQFVKQDHEIRLVYKDMPILGPASVLGSRALLAAQKQGAYARLRTALMSAPPDFSMDSIRQASRKLGLDWKRLRRDMDDPAVKKRLDDNVALGSAIGINGTPTLIIEEKTASGTDLEVVSGANIAGVKQAVAALRAASKTAGESQANESVQKKKSGSRL